MCRALGIEHLVLDLSDRFCRQVVDAFAEEYRRGRTPNPCVVCNRTIKFGGMLDYARQQGLSLIHISTADSLIIFDEIGRGTSTYDGMSIARAVLEYVASPRKVCLLYTSPSST